MSGFSNEPSISELFQIERWIEDLLEDTETDVPDFRTNNECLKLLRSLISCNKEADKDTEEIIKAESSLHDFYSAKKDDLSNIFAEEFSMSDLHPDTAEKVKKIAHIAVQMRLKDPTLTYFLLSASSLDNEKAFHIEQELIDSFALSKFSKKISETIHKNAIHERNIEKLTRISEHKSIKAALPDQCKFFKMKADEYTKNIKKGERHLKNLGWNSSLSHDELVKKSESLQNLEQREKDLSIKLESYQNLPANEVLAQFKIEEAKAELLSLQKEFNDLLKF